MGKLSFITKKSFLRAVIIAVTLYILVFLFVVVGLRIYTHHGKSFPVPDFKGLSQERTNQLAEYNNLQIKIVDSMYISYLPKGSVIDQNPRPGVNVKKGRTIFCTTNAFKQVEVNVPRVVGYSFRQGKTILESRGLNVGKLIYEPDFAKNNILKQMYNGKLIVEGSKIEKGSSIDLVLGNGLGQSMSPIPNLVSLSYKDAINKINDNFLNLGNVLFDETVVNFADSLNAIVYQQEPAYSEYGKAVMGTKLNVWMTTDSLKIPEQDTTVVVNL